LTILAFIAALGSGIIAGLFFTFSTFAMTALGRLPAPNGIAAMNAINGAIINPWFFAAFFGTAAVSLVLAGVTLFRLSAPGSAWLLAGGLLYLAGVIVVTMIFNVPLNNALARSDPASAEAARLWTRYLSVWTAWNHVRTVASIAATAAFILALMRLRAA
jgi:uncharacterized membrane protein